MNAYFTDALSSRAVTGRAIPEATVGRLPVYLRALVELAEAGDPTVSSDALAIATGVNSAKVRKDLSHLGSYGTRGSATTSLTSSTRSVASSG